ncbi:MAG: glutathione S-transferase, partial [Sphingomonas sp.]|nr:glutathione S-transferase [Sphingomonas sp.]
FVGAMVGFMLQFKVLEPRPAFTDYAARMTDRDAYRRAQEIDGKLIAEAQANHPQPAQ